MGSHVGEIVFGIKINEKTFKRLKKNKNITEKNEFDHDLFNESKPIYPYNPDATYAFLIIVKESLKDAYDDATALGVELKAQDGWVEQIESFCEQNKVKFKAPQWYVIGRYD